MDVFIFNHMGVTFEKAYQTFIQSRSKNGDELRSPIGRQLHLVIKTDGKWNGEDVFWTCDLTLIFIRIMELWFIVYVNWIPKTTCDVNSEQQNFW